jgi:hypothetical protein
MKWVRSGIGGLLTSRLGHLQLQRAGAGPNRRTGIDKLVASRTVAQW